MAEFCSVYFFIAPRYPTTCFCWCLRAVISVQATQITWPSAAPSKSERPRWPGLTRRSQLDYSEINCTGPSCVCLLCQSAQPWWSNSPQRIHCCGVRDWARGLHDFRCAVASLLVCGIRCKRWRAVVVGYWGFVVMPMGLESAIGAGDIQAYIDKCSMDWVSPATSCLEGRLLGIIQWSFVCVCVCVCIYQCLCIDGSIGATIKVVWLPLISGHDVAVFQLLFGVDFSFLEWW